MWVGAQDPRMLSFSLIVYVNQNSRKSTAIKIIHHTSDVFQRKQIFTSVSLHLAAQYGDQILH